MLRRLLIGVAAGVLSTPVSLIFAYVIGFAAIAAKTRDLFATLLTAVTFLPLMLAIVLAVPTLVIAMLIGLTLSALVDFTNRFLIIIGAFLGLVFAEIVLSVVLPLVFIPQPGDFTSIISNYYVAGAYGVILGGLTTQLFRWLNRSM